MYEVAEGWREAALAFALELAGEGENFPKRVLTLLDRHFGMRRSIFFQHEYAELGQPGARRGGRPGSYITYGIRYGPMYDYKEQVYRDDIFRYSLLPPHLRGRSVVLTGDIMPLSEFEQTPFGRHMAAADMHHQACLFLYMGERVAASILLPRSLSQGPYSEEERGLLEYLTRLIEQHYRSVLMQSGEVRLQEGFALFFQDLKMGALVLNQELMVVQANRAAQELSQLFREQFRGSPGRIVHGRETQEPQLRPVQLMVNEIAEALIGRGERTLTLSSVGGEMSFHHAAFHSVSAAGAIQSWHMITVTGKRKALPPDLGQPYSSLTAQERRIVYHLSTGMKNEQIAEELHISIYTVRTHIANIYKKFEVGSKVDLLMCLQPYLKSLAD